MTEQVPILPGPEDMAPWPVEIVPLDSLQPHPNNYRSHPPQQLDHLRQSLRQHGIYRPIVIAQDSTILAGHGVALAARLEAIERVPVVRLPISPYSPQALKLLAGDNETARLGIIDDKALAQIILQIQAEDEYGLMGTGFDDRTLSHLLATSGIQGIETQNDPNAEWVNMPEFHQEEVFGAYKTIKVHFATEEDYRAFARLVNQDLQPKSTHIWYPKKRQDNLKARAYIVQTEEE